MIKSMNKNVDDEKRRLLIVVVVVVAAAQEVVLININLFMDNNNKKICATLPAERNYAFFLAGKQISSDV